MDKKPYNRIEAIFEEFKEVLEEIHLSNEMKSYWNKYLDDRMPVYLRTVKQTVEEYLEGIKNVKGINDYRITEEPTGEIVVYIRPYCAISRIDLSDVLKNEGSEFV